MSIGSLGSVPGGVLGSAAGAPLSQTAGSDVERAKQDAVGQQRHVASQELAEGAAGIAKTDGQDHEANDRDADGRRLWEFAAKKSATSQATDTPVEPPHQSKDPTGESGNALDLTG